MIGKSQLVMELNINLDLYLPHPPRSSGITLHLPRVEVTHGFSWNFVQEPRQTSPLDRSLPGPPHSPTVGSVEPTDAALHFSRSCVDDTHRLPWEIT